MADSDPSAEWQETEAKARAVLLAVALAAGQRGSGAAEQYSQSSSPFPASPLPRILPTMPYRLVSFSGDQSFELPPGRTLVVGRGVNSDIAIYDPTISRRHAELIVGTDGVQVRDLGSSNGTCINGTRDHRRTAHPNDSITFGKVLFQLKEQRASGQTPSPLPMQPPAAAPGTTSSASSMLVAVGPLGSPAETAAPASASSRWRPTTAEERQAKKLSLLLDISQKLSGEFDLDRLLGNVVDMMFEVMDVDRVSILLRNESTGELVPSISRSRLGDAAFQQVPRSIVDKAIQERVAVVSDNTRTDSRFKGHSIVAQSVRSAMCSPLMASGDRILGLLYVDSVTAANSFSDEDLQFLVAFSGLVAIGIRNSRYAEQVRREAHGPLQLRALLRAQHRGRDRAAGRRRSPGRRAAARSPSSSATSVASPQWRSPWGRTPSPGC